MATSVYTVLLGELVDVAGINVLVPSPPAGFRYVLTDVEAFNVSQLIGPQLEGFTITDSAGADVWALGQWAVTQTPYHWRGRQVVDVGDSLAVDAGLNRWSFRATGFQLALP